MKKLAWISLILLFLTSCTKNNVDEMIVYKNPNCGCCTKWVQHMKDNGFKVTEKPVDNLDELKDKYGVPANKRSCHTAVYGNYVFEGHIPASSIKKFLAQKPSLKGLTVPDMPMGSPGMEHGQHREKYDVLTFDKNGNTTVFESF